MTYVVIPARYGSTRLPGKPLKLIHGKPLIQHVTERALETGYKVIVTTDNIEIANIALGLTDAFITRHANTGSDRVAMAVNNLDPYDIVVNLQGDEYGIDPDRIIQAAEAARCLQDFVTLADDMEGGVRVQRDSNGVATLFTREQIPGSMRHVGIYAAPAMDFIRFSELPQTRNELEQSLEQLRWLDNGFPMYVMKAVGKPGMSIDTQEDLERANSCSTTQTKG